MLASPPAPAPPAAPAAHPSPPAAHPCVDSLDTLLLLHRRRECRRLYGAVKADYVGVPTVEPGKQVRRHLRIAWALESRHRVEAQ